MDDEEQPEWQKQTSFSVDSVGTNAADGSGLTAPPPAKRARVDTEPAATAAWRSAPEIGAATAGPAAVEMDIDGAGSIVEAAPAAGFSGSADAMDRHVVVSKAIASSSIPASGPRKRPADDSTDTEPAETGAKASSAAAGANLHNRDASRQAEVYTDTDCGITEYIAIEVPGFHANVKQRFSDFHVREIGLDGVTAVLTSYDLPPQEGESHAASTVEAEPMAVAGAGAADSQDLVVDTPVAGVAQLRELVGEDAAIRLETLATAAPPFDVSDAVFIECGAMDKGARSAVHAAVRECYPMLETVTVPADTEFSTRIKAARARGSKKRQGRKQDDKWGPHPYCKFVLYKENKATMDALGLVKKFLKLRNDRALSFAGNKDKRGITTQWVTASKIEPKRLVGLNSRLFGIRLGNFSYVDRELSVGDLVGNAFRIVLRDVTGSAEQIDTVAHSLRTVGFINYFGMQRFGNSSVSTAEIGMALLRGQWDRVVELILGPKGGERPDVARAREEWAKTKDPRAAMARFPKSCTIERKLLGGIIQHGKKFADAFRAVPYSMRTLYVHSYQSLVWNLMASHRVTLGLEPIVGDLVLVSPDDPRATVKGGDSKGTAVKVLTAEDLGDHTIYDVVLPLPGFAVLYPENDVGKAYAARLATDGLAGPQAFKPKNKDFSLSGDYRKVVTLPGDFQWRVAQYSDFKVSLLDTDLEKLEPKEPEGAAGAAQQNDSEGVGDKTALILEFSLPASSYATMLVREFTKAPTDSDYMTSLNPAARLV